MKEPPTASVGLGAVSLRLVRLGMKEPPTAVGGIRRCECEVSRLGTKKPPTGVGGITVRLLMLSQFKLDHRLWSVGFASLGVGLWSNSRRLHHALYVRWFFAEPFGM